MKHAWIFLTLVMGLHTSLKAADEDAEKLFAKAQLALQKGNHAEAVKGFTKVLALKPAEPSRASTLQRRGEAYFKLA